MMQVRRASDRGHLNHGWLDTYHTFSFGDYHDPEQMGFRSLRVMNDDRVAPGQGFGMHGHRDMEILTYVLEGELEHRDSLGNGEVIRAGELQRMSAGTGIRHSEFNPSPTNEVHLYQIWIIPNERGMTPRYAQKVFDPVERDGKFQLVASADGRDGSFEIAQEADVYLARLHERQTVTHELTQGRHAWLQVLRGSVTLDGTPLAEGDGAAVSEAHSLSLAGDSNAEVMLFDMA